MSQRERWIVYPLLFLAVTLAGFDKIFGSGKLTFDEVVCERLKAKEIYCTEMQTVSIDGKRELVRVGSTPEGGGELLVFYQEQPQPEVILRANAGGGGLRAAAIECSRILVTDDGQRSLVDISANDQGGFVNARSRDGVWGVALGHMPTASGIFGVYNDQQPIMLDYGDRQVPWGMQFPRPVSVVPRRFPPEDGKQPAPAEGSQGNENAVEPENINEPATGNDNATQGEAAAPSGQTEQPNPADLTSTEDTPEPAGETEAPEDTSDTP